MIAKQKIFSFLTAFMLVFTIAPQAIPVYAATGNTGDNFFSGLIQFLSQKFGLDQSQVKTAMQQYSTQQKQTTQQNMQDREKKRLDTLVSQGKITAAQEQAIITELATLKSKYNPANFKTLTPDERKQQFQNEQNDVKAFAQSQGIDPTLVMPFGGRMGMRGKGGFGGKWGNKPSPTPGS